MKTQNETTKVSDLTLEEIIKLLEKKSKELGVRVKLTFITYDGKSVQPENPSNK